MVGIKYGIVIYHKPFNSSVWQDITIYSNLLSLYWSQTIGQSPLSFSIDVDKPFQSDDTTPLAIEEGDMIAVLEDSTLNKVYDNTLVGQIVSPNKRILNTDYSNDRFNIGYSLECREYNFNKYNIFDYDYAGNPLSSILTDILGTTDELIGGTVGNKIINAYSLSGLDVTAHSFKATGVSPLEALNKLCEENYLIWRIDWFSSPDSINNLALAGQIVINDKATGYTPYSPLWKYGINDTNLKIGTISNPEYIENSTLVSNIPSDVFKSFTYRLDTDLVTNFIDVDVNVYDPSETEFPTDYEKNARKIIQPDIPEFTIEYPASDIKYIAYLIRSEIVTVTSDTTFTVPEVDGLNLYVGDTIYAKSVTTGDESFGIISTITNDTDIVLESSLSFTPLAGDVLELAYSPTVMPIVDNNLEVLPSIGVTFESKADKPAKIKFMDLSKPSSGTEIVYYYKRIRAYKPIFKDTESINKYGLKKSSIKLKSDDLFNLEQIKKILRNNISYEPNKEVTLTTYRPTRAGENILVDVTDFADANDKLIVDTISGQYLGYKGGRYQRNYAEYFITMSTLRESIEDMVKKLIRRSIRATSSGEVIDTEKKSETVNVTTVSLVTVAIPEPTYTEKILYTSFEHGNQQIYIMDLDGTNPTRISNNAYIETLGNSSIGDILDNKIVFRTNQTGAGDIYQMDLDGTNRVNLSNNAKSESWCIVSANNDKVAFRRRDTSATDTDLYVMDIDGTNQTKIQDGGGVIQYFPTGYNTDGVIVMERSNVSGSQSIIATINEDGTGYNGVFSGTTSGITPVFYTKPSFGYNDFNSKFVYSMYDGISGLLTYNLRYCDIDGSNDTAITIDENTSESEHRLRPKFTYDNSQIIFQKSDGTYDQIWIIDIDGSNETQITDMGAGTGGGSFDSKTPFIIRIPD